MTNQEAIGIIKTAIAEVEWEYPMEMAAAMDRAIEALEADPGQDGMTLAQIAENHGLTPEGVDYALRQYQIVMCEITHGAMSKLSYDAHDVLRVAQDRWCETCELKEEE